jgi:hypothetical protein
MEVERMNVKQLALKRDFVKYATKYGLENDMPLDEFMEVILQSSTTAFVSLGLSLELWLEICEQTYKEGEKACEKAHKDVKN